jgi:hypothetical protein
MNVLIKNTVEEAPNILHLHQATLRSVDHIALHTSVEQYCNITQVNALPQNEGILEI